MTGAAWLTNIFGPSSKLYLEFAFGANLAASPGTWSWTDVTADLLHTTQVQITPGRADETSAAQPAQCSFALLNTAGSYTPFLPTSIYYPNVRHGTPVRVRIDLGSGPVVAFQGYADGFTPDWSASASGKLPIVKATAYGVLKRVAQRKTPLRSAMYRTISNVAPAAFWALEDGSSATMAASSVPGIAPLRPTGTVAFGADGPAGSAASLDLSGGGSLTGTVPALTAPWSVVFAYQLTSLSTPIVPVGFTTSDGMRWQVKIDPTGTPSVGVMTDSGTGFGIASGNASVADLNWHVVQLNVSQSGSTYNFFVYLDGQTVTGGPILTATVPHVTSVLVSPMNTGTSHAFFLTQLAVAPVATLNTVIPNLASSVSAFTGETASARVARVCAEEGIAATVTGSSTVAMGPQPIDTLLNILDECETADGGVIFDGFDAGLRFITCGARQNLSAALTIDASAGQLTPPFSPVDDDQRTVNDVTATRNGGGSARVTLTTGALGTAAIGTYDASIQANTSTDDALLGVAGWSVNLGTVEGLRYPSLAVDFTQTPSLAATWLANFPGGFRVDISNAHTVVAQAPPDPIALLVEGWTMSIDLETFALQANCIPYAPWQVAVYGTARYDSASSSVVSGVTSSATTLQVINTSNLWTVDPTQFPFDIGVGGERMTVSAIAPGISDNFNRSTTTGGWFTSSSGATWTAASNGADFFVSISPAEGIITPSAAASDRLITVDTGSSSHYAEAKIGAFGAASGGVARQGITACFVDSSNHYLGYLEESLTGVLTAIVAKRVTGTLTTLASLALPSTFSLISSDILVSLKAIQGTSGATLEFRVYPQATNVEPLSPLLSVVDSSLSGTRCGVFARREGTAPSTFGTKSFAVKTPQAFTVTRAVNGVSKAQSAGTSVSLWTPTRYAH